MAAALAQHQSGSNFGTTVAASFTTVTTANRLLTAVIQDQQTTDITGITDNAGNTWVKATSLEVTAQKHIEIWYAANAAACQNVTAALGSTSINANMSVQEWSGTSGWTLRNATTVSNASSTTAAGTVACQAGDIILAGLAYLEASSGTRQDSLTTGTALDALARGTTAFNSAYRITTGTSDGCAWAMSPAVSSVVATASFGPTASNAPPTAVIDAPQTNVWPWSTVTHSGAASSDSDGTVTGYAWTQTGGTAVTLTGASSASVSYTAPQTRNGTTVTLQLVVTDNNGATSSPATVTDTIDPVNQWAVVGGAEVPLHIQAVT